MTRKSSSRRRWPEHESSEYTGGVILYDPDPPLDPSFKAFHKQTASRVKKVLKRNGFPLHPETVQRLITSVSPAEIKRLEDEARKGPLPPLDDRSLNEYMRVVAATDKSSRKGLVAEFVSEGLVAYEERKVCTPSPLPGVNPYSRSQTHLQASPNGIDAAWMWDQPHGRGRGVAVVDVEESWNLDHEDLVRNRPWLLCGDNFRGSVLYEGDHGTGVLGILMAANNDVGVRGIAPGVTRVGVASHYDANTGSHDNITNAIVKALSVLRPGDVVLIEVFRGQNLPVEVDEADFRAIRLASGLGVVVVEAAGNGREDLGTVTDNRGNLLFTRKKERESGAILVTASENTPQSYRRMLNYGSRIDCFAHGRGVVTAGGGDLNTTVKDENAMYTRCFDGTSAAAAIVAGAAILVQGRYKALHGKPLPPLALREMLTTTGTKAHSPAEGIGAMPNLRNLVETYPEMQRPQSPP